MTADSSWKGLSWDDTTASGNLAPELITEVSLGRQANQAGRLLLVTRLSFKRWPDANSFTLIT